MTAARTPRSAKKRSASAEGAGPGKKAGGARKPSAARKPAAASKAAKAGGAGKAARSRGPSRAKPEVTLAIDIGGTGLKASVLDPSGHMEVDRVRVPTEYPCPPSAMVKTLTELVRPLPAYGRVSAGFPGVVRDGVVVTAPHFITKSGPGTKVVPDLLEAWTGFDLAGALQAKLSKPTKVVNDADLQGAAVVEGKGLELMVTLGTGVGSGLYLHGRLAPHLELAHHPLRKGETYNEQLGNDARKRIGNHKWNRRVKRAVETMDALLFFDRVYVGGGNSRHITVDLGPKAKIVENSAGILGGIKLWDRPTL